MSKNNPNVNVFADQNYAVWTAPIGTALPATLPPTNPGAAFDEVGLLSDAGITEAHNVNETKIYDMAGALIRIARTQEERPFTFTALEGNAVVDSLRFPGSVFTPGAGTACTQTITMTGTGTAGTWDLSSPDFGTAKGLAFAITGAALIAALQAAWGVTVTCTATPGTSYAITTPIAAGNVGPFTVANHITGVTAITVVQTTPGVDSVNSRQVSTGTGRNLRVWCIDLVDGTTHKRIAINNGEALWTGTTTYNGAGAAEYEFTLQPYKDSAGNYYTILDDDPADAESFA